MELGAEIFCGNRFTAFDFLFGGLDVFNEFQCFFQPVEVRCAILPCKDGSCLYKGGSSRAAAASGVWIKRKTKDWPLGGDFVLFR